MTKFYRPDSLEQVFRLLEQEEDARILAGGQTLVPMMNLGLVQPGAIVSLGSVRALRGIERLPDGTVRIGAMTTHAELADAVLEGGQRLLSQAAIRIASPAIRSRGTIGGSCMHGDSTSDWPVALCAADAVLELRSTAGTREVPAHAFFLDFLTTAARPDEILSAVIVPPLPGQSVYLKFGRVEGDNATVSVAAVADMSGGRCGFVRLAAGSMGPKPVRSTQAEAALLGQPVDAQRAAEAAALLAADTSPMSDVRGSADYKLRVLQNLARQAILDCTTPCSNVN